MHGKKSNLLTPARRPCDVMRHRIPGLSGEEQEEVGQHNCPRLHAERETREHNLIPNGTQTICKYQTEHDGTTNEKLHCLGHLIPPPVSVRAAICELKVPRPRWLTKFHGQALKSRCPSHEMPLIATTMTAQVTPRYINFRESRLRASANDSVPVSLFTSPMELSQSLAVSSI